MARRGSHWGSFGKGFMESFLAAYRMSMTADLYANRDRHWRAQEEYWKNIGLAKGAKQRDLDEQIRRGRDDPNFHPSEGGGAGGGTNYAGPDNVKDYVTQAAEARGIDPKVALNFVQGESSGNTNAKGDDGSSFGLFQLHYGGVSSVPALSHPGLGDAFTAATGLNARDASTWKQQVDFALDRAKVGGWGDWANTQKKYGYDRFAGIDRNAPTTTAKATEADKPTKTATAEEATTPSPSGAFVAPGGRPEQDQREVLAAPSPSAADETVTADKSLQQGPLPRSPGPEDPSIFARQRGLAIPPAPTPPVSMPARVASQPYPQPYESGYPTPAAIPIGGGAGNVMEAPRGTPAGANAPAANASPAVALTPESNPAIPNNPRFVQIDQPNIARMGNARGGREGEGNAPQMGAPNLSWGPNTPLDQRSANAGSNNIVLASSQGDRAGQTVQAPMPPPRPSDDTDMVSAPDMSAMTGADFSPVGARKGGSIRPAIPRYATGGAVTKFVSGGATLGTPATVADLSSSAYVGPTVSGGWVGTPYNQLAPNQQAWADQQTAAIGKISSTNPNDPAAQQALFASFTMMPDAVWPTAAAPAAPAPLSEPAPVVTPISTPTLTSTTSDAANGGATTGAYQIPNIVAPTTNPAINQNNTTINPTPNIPTTLVPNTPGVGAGASDIGGTNFKPTNNGSANYGGDNLNTGAYAGFKRGGAIPRGPATGMFAAGGMVTKFATGGAAPTAAQLADPGWQNTPSTYTLPGNAPFTNQQVYDLSQTINSSPQPFLSPLSPSGSKDLTGFYGAYTPPAAAPAAAPSPISEPAPAVNAVSTPMLTSTTSDAANGGATTGAYQMPNIVAPTTNPSINAPSTTVNPTPKIPTTLVPNTPGVGAGASDIGGTNFKPTNTGGATAGDTSLNTGAYAGFRRGGAIPRYATGGMVTRFAAAGTVQPQQVQSALNAALYGPNAPYSEQQVNAGSPTMTVGQMQAANLAALTPDQQAWYNAQNAALLGYQNATQAWSGAITPATGGFGGQANTVNQGQQALAQNQQAYYQGLFDPNMPAAPAPAAAQAAAPATGAATTPAIPPTVNPISTPNLITTGDVGGKTTGAYQLPNIVAPTNNPVINTPTTTINPTPKIPTTLVPNTPSTGASDIGATDPTKKTPTAGDTSLSTGSYAGFRRGGVTRRVTGYDDGGGVSPAPAGMLPGMGGGQPVPPIYYNPATYAGAGAPVGKGVTNTSAPTYVAGAIPSLPMARGGIVRYADGGDVQQPDPSDPLAGMDQVALNDDPGDARIEQDIASRSAAENAPATQPTEPGMPAFTGYFSPPQDQPAPALAPTQGGGAQGGAQEDPHRPSGLLPYAAQGSDPNGNPSNGFISALTGGLHWLADHFGVVGGAQAGQQALAPDPQSQENRQMAASRANLMTRNDRELLNNMADPHHTLDEFMRNINGLEQGYRWLLSQGDIVGANKMAASVIQYDVANANQYQEEAARRYYDGDLPGAVKAINQAADAVPADQRFHAELAPDGKDLIITGSDLKGRELWKQYAAPAAILGAVNPSMPYVMLENQAARYDPYFREMAKARAGAVKERYSDQQAVAAAQKFAPPRQAVTPQSNAPAPAAPMPSVPTPPPTITAGGAGGAPTATPPVVANAGTATPASPPPGGDTGGAMAALPPQPTNGDIGAAGAAPVASQTPDFNKIAASLDQQANIRHEQVALEAQQRYQSQYENYPDPALVKNKADLTAFNARRNEVAAHNAQVDKSKSEYLAGRQKDVSDDVAAQRARLLAQETDARAAAGREATDTRAEAGRRATDERADKARTAGYEHEEQRPLPYTEGEKIEGVKTISSVPRNAVYKSDGTLDETASAQNTAKAYDLGAPATGGLQRLNLVSDAVRNIQTWNTHIGVNQVGDLVDGLARKIYSIDPNPKTVDHGYGPMYQVNVYRGPRGSTHPTVLLVPQDDFDTISNIRAEFAAASAPTTTGAGTGSPAQAPAIPPPPVPLSQTTVRPPVPLITSTPGKPNVPGPVTPLRLPERVPVEQMPPEQRQLYPELNQ